MQTFKKFLVENIYPGGYYDAYGNLKVHFDNAEEKKKFDDDPRNDARSDDWHYERDKEHENMTKRVDTAKKVDSKVSNTIKSVQGASNDLISHINKEVFGYVVAAVYLLSHVQLFATPWTVAHPFPLSMGFPRQEY